MFDGVSECGSDHATCVALQCHDIGRRSARVCPVGPKTHPANVGDVSHGHAESTPPLWIGPAESLSDHPSSTTEGWFFASIPAESWVVLISLLSSMHRLGHDQPIASESKVNCGYSMRAYGSTGFGRLGTLDTDQWGIWRQISRDHDHNKKRRGKPRGVFDRFWFAGNQEAG